MKFFDLKRTTLAMMILAGAARLAWSQTAITDSVLPPDHLLENLPWMGDDGKVDNKGLFDFEDLRSLGLKDLILIYRQTVPVNELDKPHNQTLAACFYDPTQKKYTKNFEDDGGSIQWVRLMTAPEGKHSFLVYERDDLKGGQVLKAYAYLDGAFKQVLEAEANQVFTVFHDGTEILCSSKEAPKDKPDAEHVFAWDEAKGQFADENVVTAANGWSGFSIAIATPVVAAQAASPASVKPAKPGRKSAAGWWDVPFDAQVSFDKLKKEIVPDRIKDNKIAQLGQDAKAFFQEAQKNGVKGKDFIAMRAGYYAAVANALYSLNHNKDAAYYLDLALKLQSDNPEGLALKEKMKQ